MADQAANPNRLGLKMAKISWGWLGWASAMVGLVVFFVWVRRDAQFSLPAGECKPNALISRVHHVILQRFFQILQKLRGVGVLFHGFPIGVAGHHLDLQ